MMELGGEEWSVAQILHEQRGRDEARVMLSNGERCLFGKIADPYPGSDQSQNQIE